MNERIQELYQKAIQNTMDYHKENPKTKQKELDNFCASEFSELIVQECGVALSPMLRDMISRGQAYDLIKDHFGVKE